MPDQEDEDRLFEHRKFLVLAEQKAQEDFDKTVLALSAGALGVSFAFIKDVVGGQPVGATSFLIVAWLSWAFSAFSVLASYYLSQLALRHAIGQVDRRVSSKERPGGKFASWTAVLNAAGAILFLIGTCSMTVCVSANASNIGVVHERKEAAPVPATTCVSGSADETDASESAGKTALGGGPQGTDHGGISTATPTPGEKQHQ